MVTDAVLQRIVEDAKAAQRPRAKSEVRDDVSQTSSNVSLQRERLRQKELELLAWDELLM